MVAPSANPRLRTLRQIAAVTQKEANIYCTVDDSVTRVKTARDETLPPLSLSLSLAMS